ncbi:MAG: hypothetical protein PHF86_00190 [Candidatus Nanoarchaeia archaeon]|nr:hypothetical protein [Candidatus Nanoarchaeia archaeon]
MNKLDNKLFYFGTDLNYAGHYFWELSEDEINDSKIRFNDIPFDPEHLPTNIYENGFVIFYHIEEYSIIQIIGSCSDKRPGSHSIFWIKKLITKEEFIEFLKSIPIVQKIINKMPFKVQW